MGTKKKPTVYLAGPISGCNEEQQKAWRRIVRDRGNSEFTFIDPTDADSLVVDPGPTYAIIQRQERALEKADAVLANMWKESIGTAIEVFNARCQGIPVVVVDPNHLKNRMIAFYVDAVEQTLADGMKTIRNILRARSRLMIVIRRDGSEEPFERDKLVESVRGACRDVNKNDVLLPAAIVPRVLSLLVEADQAAPGKITSKTIRDAVWNTLAEIEADPIRQSDFAGIRDAWENFAAGKRPSVVRERSKPSIPAVHPRPLKVAVRSFKSHATIWGKAVTSLANVPLPARQLFQEICRVEGIAEIRITEMGTAPKTDGVRAEILASRTPGILEGKCYAFGKRGGLQMFQIRVHDVGRTEAIRAQLLKHLDEQHLLKLEQAEA